MQSTTPPIETVKSTSQEALQDHDAIPVLIELCKAGNVFAVQDWLKAGKPINPSRAWSNRRRTPLEVSIERGFYSLTLILLEAGATFERCGRCRAMSRAIASRRFDLVKLLVDHGYDPTTVDLLDVFETWDGQLMDYFIERGADLETGNPLAHALCNRVRTALHAFKRYRERFPGLQRQVDLALRHHCKSGQIKWVSLLLWAGADPYSLGSDDPNAEITSESEGYSALAIAALYHRHDVFRLKQVKLDANHPSLRVAAQWSCDREGVWLLQCLIDHGFPLNDRPNGGSSLISHSVQRMSWNLRSKINGEKREPSAKIDSSEATEQIEVIEFLVRHGARWAPIDEDEIKAARRSLLKLVPRFALALFSILATSKACTKEAATSLFKNSAMKKHLASYYSLIERFLETLPT